MSIPLAFPGALGRGGRTGLPESALIVNKSYVLQSYAKMLFCQSAVLFGRGAAARHGGSLLYYIAKFYFRILVATFCRGLHLGKVVVLG